MLIDIKVCCLHGAENYQKPKMTALYLLVDLDTPPPHTHTRTSTNETESDNKSQQMNE